MGEDQKWHFFQHWVIIYQTKHLSIQLSKFAHDRLHIEVYDKYTLLATNI